MTDEEIHNIYLHMSGKAEGLAEATGKADFPSLFARAILKHSKREWVGMTEAEIMELVEMYSGVNPNRYMLIKDTQYKLREKNAQD